MKERVREAWEDFERRVVPQGAGVVQRREMRRTFYQGAFAVLAMLTRDMTPEGTELSESDEQIVKDLASEMELFVADLVQGKA